MEAGRGEVGRSGLPRFTTNGVWRGCVEIAPIAAFIIPFGIAFGVAASAKGVPGEISVLMSIVVFAGASQFAALDLWHAPLPIATLALTVLAVNARHILLGAVTQVLQYVLPNDVLVFRDAFLFSGVLLLLIWRPQGLFINSRKVQERA